jgi:hypothetical protein
MKNVWWFDGRGRDAELDVSLWKDLTFIVLALWKG